MDALAAVERLASEGQREALAALEAHVDPRIELVPSEASRVLLERDGLLALPAEGIRTALAQLAADETIEWASQTVTWGAVLSGFAGHCRDELDDVDVVEEERARLVARWRRETSLIELRTGFVACAKLATETPTMLLGDIDRDLDTLVESFASDVALRSRLAVIDLRRLEKINAVRSSVFVYFEWFLRDAYGVKLLPAPAFTQGLINRGIISLGFG